jgi:transcriptional regulator with XRE-family HTH domain
LQIISFTYILRAMPAQPLTKEQLEDAVRLKERFLAWQRARKEAGLPSSQEAVSELLGFNQSSMSQYLNGKIPLNFAAATKFASVLECSIAEFSRTLAQQATKFLAAALPSDAPIYDTRAADAISILVGEEPNTVPVKRMNLKLRAGVSRMGAEPDLSDGGVLHIPRAVVEQHSLRPEDLLAVRVRGTSMEPMLFEDDTVVVDTSDRRPVSRELYALQFDGDACVKQLLNKGGQWYLHSLNPDHKPVNVKSGQLDIIGRVVYQPGRVVTGRL